jgi:hypothetical protein
VGGNGKHTRLTRIHATRHAWRVALRRRATQRITARLWAAGRPSRAVLSRTPEPLTPPHPHPHPQRGEGVGEGVGRRWGLGGESGGVASGTACASARARPTPTPQLGPAPADPPRPSESLTYPSSGWIGHLAWRVWVGMGGGADAWVGAGPGHWMRIAAKMKKFRVRLGAQHAALATTRCRAVRWVRDSESRMRCRHHHHDAVGWMRDSGLEVVFGWGAWGFVSLAAGKAGFALHMTCCPPPPSLFLPDFFCSLWLVV